MFYFFLFFWFRWKFGFRTDVPKSERWTRRSCSSRRRPPPRPLLRAPTSAAAAAAAAVWVWCRPLFPWLLKKSTEEEESTRHTWDLHHTLKDISVLCEAELWWAAALCCTSTKENFYCCLWFCLLVCFLAINYVCFPQSRVWNVCKCFQFKCLKA